MRRIAHLVAKELRQLLRDRRLLPFVFVMPVFQLIIFGFAVSTDTKNIRIAVCDQDRTLQSRKLLTDLATSDYFSRTSDVESPRQIETVLRQHSASIVLVIPPGYGESVLRGSTARLQAILDGSDANAGTVALGYLARMVNASGTTILQSRLARFGRARLVGGGVTAETRVWYNPALRSAAFMVPGVIAVIVGMVCTMLTALAIVKERELGTIEQLMVTPLRPWELIVGKTLPFMLVGYADVIVALAAGRWLLGVEIQGSLGLLLALAGIFITASLAVGILISTSATTQQQAQFTALFFTMPNMLLSGFMFPIENMPSVLRAVTFLLPMRYFVVILRGIYLRGVGLEVLWPQAAAMSAITLVILAAAVMRFHKRLD